MRAKICVHCSVYTRAKIEYVEYEWCFLCVELMCCCDEMCKKSKLDETREIKNEGKIVANTQNNISQIDECENIVGARLAGTSLAKLLPQQ